MIEDDLPGFLTADAAVRALVVEPKLSRIFPKVIPQNVVGEAKKQPCLVYTTDGTVRSSTYCATDKLVRTSFQFDFYALTDTKMRALAKAVFDRLIDCRGMMGATKVRIALIDNEFDGTDPDPGLYRRTQLWTIWHVED